MKTERLPRLFNGTGSIRLPAAWHRLAKLNDDGMELAFYASDTGDLIYRDRAAIIGGDGPPAAAPF
jgi:hypothetical protein